MDQNINENNKINVDFNQEISVQNTMSKKSGNKRIKIVIICIFIYFIFKYILFGYHAIDFKTDKQVKEYLTQYINEKYNTDCNLDLKSKELVKFCTAMLDGCIHYANNNSIYRYEYSGVDKNNNEFLVNYTNSYIGKDGITKAEIEENYYIYNHIKEIKKIVKEYYNTFDIYYELSNNGIDDYEIVIRIYSNKKNVTVLTDINDKILNFNKMFKIIFTTDHKTYKQILNDDSNLSKQSYSWEEPNFLTKKLGYSSRKDNFNNNSEYKRALSLIDLENDNYTIILMNGFSKTNYYIYHK